MSKLNDERLKEIRTLRAQEREKCHWGHVGELLDHIDALQAEVSRLQRAEAETLSQLKAMNDIEAALQAELAESREHKRLLFEENGRLLEEKESGLWDTNHPVRKELAQTRALLAVRTQALEVIHKELEDPHVPGGCRTCVGTHADFNDVTTSRSVAGKALSSDGTEELAAIRGALDCLTMVTDFTWDFKDIDIPWVQDWAHANHSKMKSALAALKKYFGGGGV